MFAHRYIWLHALCGGFFIFFAACATLSEDQCQAINWHQLGDTDGMQGFKKQRLDLHDKACSKHGLPIDKEAYLVGWQKGISRYCTPKNGFREGSLGRGYRNSCPAPLAAPFVEAYSVAYEFYRAKSEVSRLEADIDNAIHKITDLSKSEDPEDLKRLKRERDNLEINKFSLSSARHRKKKAEEAVFNYLKAHPEVRLT